MDKLDEIFLKQQELDNIIGFNNKPYSKRIEENFTALIHEWCELHDEINWKPWQNTLKTVDDNKLLEEYVDVIHFIIQRALVDGFTAKQVFDAYIKKNLINRERVKKGY